MMGGLPIEIFDGIRKGTFDNRAQFFKDLSLPFYGYNRDGAVISEALRDDFVRQGMMGGLKGELDSIRAFSESDFTQDLRKVDVPTLVLHGDDDQIVPIGAAALSTVKIVTHAVLKVYEGADHGLTATHQDRFNADLLDFIKG
jgi:non-heme chloroperoxidase